MPLGTPGAGFSSRGQPSDRGLSANLHSNHGSFLGRGPYRGPTGRLRSETQPWERTTLPPTLVTWAIPEALPLSEVGQAYGDSFPELLLTPG